VDLRPAGQQAGGPLAELLHVRAAPVRLQRRGRRPPLEHHERVRPAEPAVQVVAQAALLGADLRRQFRPAREQFVRLAVLRGQHRHDAYFVSHSRGLCQTSHQRLSVASRNP
jgi:hypothetical protein